MKWLAIILLCVSTLYAQDHTSNSEERFANMRITQNALRNLYKAVQKSRAVNDPLGMATAMDEAGKWF